MIVKLGYFSTMFSSLSELWLAELVLPLLQGAHTALGPGSSVVAHDESSNRCVVSPSESGMRQFKSSRLA